PYSRDGVRPRQRRLGRPARKDFRPDARAEIRTRMIHDPVLSFFAGGLVFSVALLGAFWKVVKDTWRERNSTSLSPEVPGDYNPTDRHTRQIDLNDENPP